MIKKYYTTQKIKSLKGYVLVLFEKMDRHRSERISHYIAKKFSEDKKVKILPSVSSGYITGFICKKDKVDEILKVGEDENYELE